MSKTIQSILQQEYQIRATRVRQDRHQCNMSDTSATETTRLRREWKILITTRLKTYFHTPILAIWQMNVTKRDTISFKNYLLEILSSCANKSLKNAPQKLNFVIAKALSKSYTLDCCCRYSYTFPLSCTW